MLDQWPTLDIACSNQYQIPVQVKKVKSNCIQSARDNEGEFCHLHHFVSDAERLEFIDSLLADNKYVIPVAECMERGVHGPNAMQRESKAAN